MPLNIMCERERMKKEDVNTAAKFILLKNEKKILENNKTCYNYNF